MGVPPSAGTAVAVFDPSAVAEPGDAEPDPMPTTVLFALLRELLTDTPDVTEALDRAVVDAERWYAKTQGVQVTDAHRATAAAILAAEGDAP
jgi:hypothetical protein